MRWDTFLMSLPGVLSRDPELRDALEGVAKIFVEEILAYGPKEEARASDESPERDEDGWVVIDVN